MLKRIKFFKGFLNKKSLIVSNNDVTNQRSDGLKKLCANLSYILPNFESNFSKLQDPNTKISSGLLQYLNNNRSRTAYFLPVKLLNAGKNMLTTVFAAAAIFYMLFVAPYGIDITI